MSVPVIIISGFLGAGKTSLLNWLLSADHKLSIGVLVNDFGAINIDSKLVEGVEGDTVSLSNGCVCCSIREDLVAACLNLLKRDSPPDYLVVECSGVSDPTTIVNTFDQPELQSLLHIDNLLAVVDCEQFPKLVQGELGYLASNQIKLADTVILNKVDLVTQSDLSDLKQTMLSMVPEAHLFEVNQGRVPFELVFGFQRNAKPSRSNEKTLVETHRHEHGHPFTTWSWKTDRPLSLPKLRTVIEQLPDSVCRAKGIVCLEELPSYQTVFQMVGKRYNFRDGDIWGNIKPHSELVLIATGNEVDFESIRETLEGCIGTGDESASPMLRLSRQLELHAV